MKFYYDPLKLKRTKFTTIVLSAYPLKVFRIMKITALLMTLFCLQISARAFSQRVSLNERNMPLEKVLKEIKHQTGIYFLYDVDLLKQRSKPVTINVVNTAVEDVMVIVLKSQPFSWEIAENTILIKPVFVKPTASPLPQQNIDVHGKVIDENGRPLTGVTVNVKSSSLGTVTNEKGDFILANVSDNATLIISYMGYVAKEVKATAQIGVVSLVPSIGTLNDVVVTGYTSYSRNQSSNAATLVSSEKINQVPGLTLDQILQGRVPGMSVISSSGQPGQAAAVIIRGIGSVNGSSTPLYVLDGIPIEGTYFQTINPEDIESATVLKDASAKALYGSRGSNGVIVLTTKKGKIGKVAVQYNSQYGISKLSRPNFIMMNTAERLQFEEEIGATYNRTLGPGWTYSPKNPAYATGTPAFRARANAILDSLRGINTDWRDQFFRTGKFQEQQVSISGGNDGLRFYNSLNYYKQEGVAKRTGLDRYALRSNLDFKSGKFSGSTNISIGYSNSSFTEGEGGTGVGTSMASVYYALPYENPYAPDGTLIHQGNKNQYNILDLREGSQGLERLFNSSNKTDQLKSIIGMSFAYQILPELKITTRAGIDYRNSTDQLYINPDSYYGSRSVANTLGGKGRFEEATRRSFNIISTSGLTYSKVFNNVHDLEVSGFYEYIYNNYNSFGFTGFGLDGRLPETPAAITNGSATFLPNVSGSKETYALASIMGIARYTYNSKYTLTGSYRYDGSTRLAPVNKWHGFYSFGANWNVKKEDFLTDIDFVSNLRFRGSYGTTASPLSGAFNYLATYSVSTSYASLPATRPVSYGNPNYDWEYVNELNIGFDLGLFRNERFRLTFDYYNKKTSNMFFNQPLSAVAGSDDGYLPLSSGKMFNRGVEFDISGDIVKNSVWTWTLGANAGYNQNKITFLTPLANLLPDGDTRVFKEGMPYGTYYAPDWAGVDPQTGNAQYYNLDGSITTTYNAAAQNATNSGSLFPKFTGGFSTSLRWKNFNASALFSFVSGVKRWNNEDFYNENQRYASSNQSIRMLNDIWKKPGDIATLQRFDVPRNFTSKDIQDASFLRFRNLNIGYNIPQAALQKIKVFKSVRIFVQGQNLLTWTKWRGLDPENNSVYGRFQYPNTRTFTAGLNVNL
ncbi:SusC/RagA family TonB-linked outer membrane protein [uncultured Mucilaginibacter sp.]|uniref:SusC/RagA family TonB-linked outer membrane protein n=1 Tax=uncultured Mucilaginibacter sp. TaxID=797541 RepID=UPI0025D2AEA8|nr:SusC/RagA family TonB-linked outer membrane protein [uncultured Mucilaginibacter sp.]